jgi:hypothetical protein
LSVAPTLLRPVFAALPKSAQAALTTIEGYDTLLPQEQRTLEEAMVKVETDPTPETDKTLLVTVPKSTVPGGAAEEDVSEKAKGAGTTGLKQPPQGQVARAKGKVCWKFAGAFYREHILEGENILENIRAKCKACWKFAGTSY